MDLPSVTTLISPTDRASIPASGLLLGGGTWVFSEPQLGHDALIDLRALGWRSITVRSDGLDVAATATLAELAEYHYPSSWTAASLFRAGAQCLLASFKVLGSATIGGNLALAYPAGAMIAVSVALEAQVLIWRANGATDLVPAADFVTWSDHTVLRPGDVIRSLHFPVEALRTPSALRKAALSDRGRSGVLVIGRTRADGAPHLVVTAATHRPLVFGAGTDFTRLADAIDPALLVDDVHGSADWRRAVAGVFAAEIAEELGWEQ